MNKGAAMAVVAAAIEKFSDRKQRLCWVVNLYEALGISGSDLPTDPEGNPLWGTYLRRLKKALNNQPDGSACGVALAVKYRLADGKFVSLTYDLPFSVSLDAIAHAEPPIGCWRLAPWPPPHTWRTVSAGSGRGQGDLHPLPVSFWYDGIPF